MKLRNVLLSVFATFAFLSVVCCTSENVLPRDKRETPSLLMKYDAKAGRILKRMTLEEKIEMLHAKYYFVSAGVPRLKIADINYADGPFGIREEMEPLSWNPLHWETDSATFFPTGSALAATWDKEMAYIYGTGMAREAKLRGKDMILGPAMNIQRIPTGGRTYEYLSEDPYLNSIIATYYTKGVQDNGVAVCLKHFALNNQETNRGTVDVIASARAMREIYLPAFEAAVTKGDAWGVMAAYNKINGAWCAENDWLLNQVLRRDWGFKGMVISDWGGTHSTGSVVKGLNVEMPSKDFLGQSLLDSVRLGIIDTAVIDNRVREILRVRLAVEPVPANKANKEITAKPEQAQIAYKVAQKSIVLLKNSDDILPLDLSRIQTVAVIGDNADKKMGQGGVGAGVKARNEITPLAGLKEAFGNNVRIIYAQGWSSQQHGGFGFGFWGSRNNAPSGPSAQELENRAVEAARAADVVIVMAGNNRSVETEGSDRKDIMLPFNQEQVISKIAQVNPNVITVLVVGAPVDLRQVDPASKAMLVSWFNGSEGGHALADILLGKVSPSGRLPFTFPVKLEDSPAYALGNFPNDTPAAADIFVNLVDKKSDASQQSRNVSVYSEDLLVGYRWYNTKKIQPAYPFGYGLTYTTFAYSDISADKTEYKDGDDIKISFRLKNLGNRKAEEVPQLYVSRIKSKVEWPERELKAFDRILLEPGQDSLVTLSVPVENLKYWSEDKYDWVLESGSIRLTVGQCATDDKLSTQVSVRKGLF